MKKWIICLAMAFCCCLVCACGQSIGASSSDDSQSSIESREDSSFSSENGDNDLDWGSGYEEDSSSLESSEESSIENSVAGDNDLYWDSTQQ